MFPRKIILTTMCSAGVWLVDTDEPTFSPHNKHHRNIRPYLYLPTLQLSPILDKRRHFSHFLTLFLSLKTNIQIDSDTEQVKM